MKGVSPAKDWKNVRKRKEIYKYNETDCDITFGLWRHMIFMQEISAPTNNSFEPIVSLRVADVDMPILLGKKRQMFLSDWKKLVEQHRG